MCLESAFRRDKTSGFACNPAELTTYLLAAELSRAKSIPRFDRSIIVLRPRTALCAFGKFNRGSEATCLFGPNEAKSRDATSESS